MSRITIQNCTTLLSANSADAGSKYLRRLDGFKLLPYGPAQNKRMRLEISIEYCSLWNYEPQAVGLTEKLLKLKQSIGSLKLIPGRGGCFEVIVNGQKIYSKLETGAFPDPEAVVKQVRALVKE